MSLEHLFAPIFPCAVHTDRIFADLVKGRRYHGQVSLCVFCVRVQAKDESLIRDRLTKQQCAG